MSVGFILTALGFVIAGREISGPEMAPWTLTAALVVGLAAALRKPAE